MKHWARIDFAFFRLQRFFPLFSHASKSSSLNPHPVITHTWHHRIFIKGQWVKPKAGYKTSSQVAIGLHPCVLRPFRCCKGPLWRWFSGDFWANRGKNQDNLGAKICFLKIVFTQCLMIYKAYYLVILQPNYFPNYLAILKPRCTLETLENMPTLISHCQKIWVERSRAGSRKLHFYQTPAGEADGVNRPSLEKFWFIKAWLWLGHLIIKFWSF